MPRILVLLLAALLLLPACGGDDEDDGSEPAQAGAEATATATSAPAEETGCEQADKPEPKPAKKLPKPKKVLEAGTTYVAVVHTSCGNFEITLDSEQAPKTGGSFVQLADKGFFDDLIFHRVVPGFVIQGGDPQGNGQGGPGYTVVEAPPQDLVYSKGVVAMAKTATDPAGASGSQFFVVTGEDAGLPPEYALLGKVTDGLEVVERIGVVETDPTTEAPVSPVVIESIEVRED
jgi:peptidyl-prolyl cis-trans isomerase B (cyclophilin B)